MTSNLYYQARKPSNIRKAWKVVYENGCSSKSEETRKYINVFTLNESRYLTRITRELKDKKFRFPPATGVLARKPGKKSSRPLVISPIESRIVQRSILNALQKHSAVRNYFMVESSFGGIEKRAVPAALRAAYNAMQSGTAYFIRSDIQSFFTKIPKNTVIQTISDAVNEPEFIDLLSNAVNVELDNLAELGRKKDLFPIYDIGVAQGSCLSPLLGNILLNQFDIEMNSGDITCLRYIDDFIIFAPNKDAAKAAFRRAQKLLQKHDLKAYGLNSDPDKVQHGETQGGFTFLGCDVRPGMIQPNRKSIRRLYSSVDLLFGESIDLMANPTSIVKRHKTLIETLISVNNILKGWGNQYAFCNNKELFEEIDRKIDEKISRYLGSYSHRRNNLTPETSYKDRRRLLGVHLLADCKYKPIVQPREQVSGTYG